MNVSDNQNYYENGREQGHKDVTDSPEDYGLSAGEQYQSISIYLAGEDGGLDVKGTNITIPVGSTGTWTTSGGNSGHGAKVIINSWNK